jgi:hypothetical protein
MQEWEDRSRCMRFVKRVNERDKEARCEVAERNRCDKEMGGEREREEKMQVARDGEGYDVERSESMERMI